MRREGEESVYVSLAYLCYMHNNQEAKENENEKVWVFHMLAQSTSEW